MLQLEEGLKDAAKNRRYPQNSIEPGQCFAHILLNRKLLMPKQQKQSDIEKFKKFFWGMINRGIYIAPSQFEAGFISIAHSEKDIEKTINAAYETFKEL